MFSQFSGKKKQPAFPMYTSLLRIPTQSLPKALLAREQAPGQREQCEEIQQQILAQLQQSPPDTPLFTALLSPDRGIVTIPPSDVGGHCLPVFSSPFRAADYVQMLLAEEPRPSYLASNAGQFLRMLRDLEEAGISHVVVDRCPRCNIFMSVAAKSLQTIQDVHFILAATLAIQIQRANLYFAYAVEKAQKGSWDGAQLVALETVGHVTQEDSQLHLLLGMLALARKDRALLQEAKALLNYFQVEEALALLAQMERTETVDFTIF